MRLRLGLLVLLTLPACTYRQMVGSFLDAGTGDTSVLESTDAAALPTRACAPAQADAGLPTSVVQVWEGYLETPLPSGADEVRIVLQEMTPGTLTGLVVFGTVAPPSPPATSEDCYPLGSLWLPQTGYPSDYPVAGFRYSITEASATDLRLQVSVRSLQPWIEWCACQTPVPAGAAGGWGCLPTTGSSATADGHCFIDDVATGAKVEVPCCKQYLCMRAMACECTATSCAINLDPMMGFDLSVNGERADGTVSFNPGGVHLVRVE